MQFTFIVIIMDGDKKFEGKRFEYWTEYFNKNKKFESVEDIPSIPVLPKEFMESVIFPGLISMGAIPKSDLVVGKVYGGRCRNASEALWNGEEFEYRRYKWGSHYIDTIPHFEDDNGSDFFIPIKELNISIIQNYGSKEKI